MTDSAAYAAQTEAIERLAAENGRLHADNRRLQVANDAKDAEIERLTSAQNSEDAANRDDTTRTDTPAPITSAGVGVWVRRSSGWPLERGHVVGSLSTEGEGKEGIEQWAIVLDRDQVVLDPVRLDL